jgi:hypothetical protein
MAEMPTSICSLFGRCIFINSEGRLVNINIVPIHGIFWPWEFLYSHDRFNYFFTFFAGFFTTFFTAFLAVIHTPL